MSANFNSLSDSLSKLETGKLFSEFQNLVSRFDTIASALENGQGSMGKLLTDEQLYENLKGASKQLDELLEDVKLNPKRYIHISVLEKQQRVHKTRQSRASRLCNTYLIFVFSPTSSWSWLLYQKYPDCYRNIKLGISCGN